MRFLLEVWMGNLVESITPAAEWVVVMILVAFTALFFLAASFGWLLGYLLESAWDAIQRWRDDRASDR
jgi:hypothetical protein